MMIRGSCFIFLQDMLGLSTCLTLKHSLSPDQRGEFSTGSKTRLNFKFWVKLCEPLQVILIPPPQFHVVKFWCSYILQL